MLCLAVERVGVTISGRLIKILRNIPRMKRYMYVGILHTMQCLQISYSFTKLDTYGEPVLRATSVTCRPAVIRT